MPPNQESTPAQNQTPTPNPAPTTPNTSTSPTPAPYTFDPALHAQVKKSNTWLAIILIFLFVVLPLGIIIGGITYIFTLHYNEAKDNKMSTSKELIAYADNLEIIINDSGQKKQDHLAGHYDIISDEVSPSDKKERDQRTLTLKLKNTDYTFKVVSSPTKCTFGIDSSCTSYAYETTTTFSAITYTDYLFTQYNQKIGYDTSYNHIYQRPDPENGKLYDAVGINSFDIDSQTSLNYIINYIDNFVDYCNQTLYGMAETNGITIILPPGITQTYDNSVHIKLTLSDNSYALTFPPKYERTNKTLRAYLNDFMTEKGIVLNP